MTRLSISDLILSPKSVFSSFNSFPRTSMITAFHFLIYDLISIMQAPLISSFRGGSSLSNNNVDEIIRYRYSIKNLSISSRELDLQNSLYEEYDSHLSAFENLNMIDDSVYIERLIYLSLGAMKDADAPALLQNIIRRKMFQSEKMTKRFLHFIEKLQKGHQMQFWQFFWSNLIYDKELEQKYIFLLGLLSENGKEVVSIAYHYFNGGITYPYGGPWDSPY